MPARFISTALLLTTASCAWAAPAGWQTYRNTEYGFTIAYPSDGSFTSGHRVEPQHSIIPVCDDTAVACFEYNGHAFDHTIIQSLGVAVMVLRDRQTEAECGEIYGRPVKQVEIHGTRFDFAETGDAAAGSSEGVSRYRAFQQYVCFEVALVTAQSDISPTQYDEYGIHPLDPNVLRAVQADMNQILESFVFKGPVRDGADWKLYWDVNCGDRYEVPAGATVHEVISDTPVVLVMPTVTCEQSFAYRSRIYTIAAKVNFSSEKQLNDWLISYGYPGLDQAMRRGAGVFEYRAATMSYFVMRGRLYLFAVSSGNGKAEPMTNDPVFKHLLGSFRPN